MQLENRKIAEVAALAGKIMLESHAESYRVEDTMKRILQTSGSTNVDVITTTTGLFLTIDASYLTDDPITLVRRVEKHGNHLNKIYWVNSISRQLTSGIITLDEAYEQLQKIDESIYPIFLKDFSIVLLVIAFTVLVGGNLNEVFLSIFAGVVVAFTRIIRDLIQMNSFIFGTITTMITAFIIHILVHVSPGISSAHVIVIAALMPLYPGTAFMNGIRDTLKGDYISGIARIVDAIIIALSLAIGVAIGLALVNVVIK